MSHNLLVCFTNCKLALEDGSLIGRDLWIDQAKGVIVDAQETFFKERRRPDTVIDLKGGIISPGLIDIQINGAYGFDFSIFENEDEKAYDDGLRMIAARIVETGVTSLLPTIITQRKELYKRLLPLLSAVSHPSSATLLGWHAEGPFLQPEKRGAHLPGYLLTAPNGIASFEAVYGTAALCESAGFIGKRDNVTFPGVRVITSAPEIEGVIPAMEQLAERGIILAIGHSAASSDVARKGVLAGGRLITHLFNAMPQMHHRDPSIIGLLGASVALAPDETPFVEGQGSINPCLSVVGTLPRLVTPPASPHVEPVKDSVTSTEPPIATANGERIIGSREVATEQKKTFIKPYYGIIVDGCHSHPHSVRLAYSAHPEGCILVTDAMPILDPHLKDGLHDWRDGRRLFIDGLKCYVAGTETLAGSVITLDACVRNFMQFTGCTLGQALKCATYNPATCLGIESFKGTLRPGADADLIVLDDNGHVKATWVAGKQVWSAEK